MAHKLNGHQRRASHQRSPGRQRSPVVASGRQRTSCAELASTSRQWSQAVAKSPVGRQSVASGHQPVVSGRQVQVASHGSSAKFMAK
eukprot:6540641-Prymnesium_polylepis.1